MVPQTSYSIDIPNWSFPGQWADDGIKDFLSALAVLAAIPYGVLVVKDAANTGGFDKLAGKVPAASSDITTLGLILGVATADQARAQDPSVAVATYPINSCVPVMKQGRVVVLSETAVVDGVQAFARFATGAGGSQKGAFRADADTATAAAVPGAYWRGTTTAAGFAVLDVDFV